MSENENLQKLLRLKKYETPGDEYFDDFLEGLKERQREDALKLSATGLLKERITQWYQDLGSEKWAVPAGSVAAVMIAFFAFGGNNGREKKISVDKNKKGPETFEIQIPKIDQFSPALPGESNGNGSVLPASYTGALREL